ncbi:MAG TPA: hypothetical protein VFH09_02345, partial [Nitrososphaera sp.]|nr:hypothetical protein [Nitrososphaera sp.]
MTGWNFDQTKKILQYDAYRLDNNNLLVYEALNYSVLFIPVAVVLLLISLTIPWVIINLRGQWFYTPIEIVGGIADGNDRNESNFSDKPNFLRFTAVSQEI